MPDNKLTVDIHLHSTHSCDAKSTIDEMCRTAVERGLQVICFTEHIDWNPKDEGLNYYRYDNHAWDIHLAQQKYAGRLQVLQGVEVSEPHLYPQEFEQLLKNCFDFVLGSVHYVGDAWVGGKQMLDTWPIAQIYDLYYSEVLKAVQAGGFDSLAHIDFPKRYLPSKLEPVELIEQILRELVRKKMALELNSSSVRRGYPELHPSDAICEMYLKIGGCRVTIGSDSHRWEQIGSNFDLINEKILKYQFQPVYYKNRQAIEIERSKK